MARHHRQKDSHPEDSHPHSSGISRALSILLSLLPLLLLTAAFTLAAVSASSKDWTYRQEYSGTYPESTPTIIIHRAPFWSCATAANASDPSILYESCSHVTDPRGLCDFDAPASDQGNSALFCQHLTVSAHLLYAGCALVGAAFLLVLLLTAATLPAVIATGSVRVFEPWFRFAAGDHDRWHHHHHHQPRRDGSRPLGLRRANHAPQSYLSAALALLSGLGALALLLGILFAVTALTIVQFNQGDWFSTGVGGTDPTQDQNNGPWLLGSAAGQCGAGAVLAAVAAFVAGMVWEGPRVGAWGWERVREEEEVDVEVVEEETVQRSPVENRVNGEGEGVEEAK